MTTLLATTVQLCAGSPFNQELELHCYTSDQNICGTIFLKFPKGYKVLVTLTYTVNHSYRFVSFSSAQPNRPTQLTCDLANSTTL